MDWAQITLNRSLAEDAAKTEKEIKTGKKKSTSTITLIYLNKIIMIIIKL